MRNTFFSIVSFIGFSALAQAGTIQQTAQFNGVSAERLFQVFTTASEHGAAIKSTVSIKPEVGATFAAFDGKLTGKVLSVTPGRQVVMSWRMPKMKPTDSDTTLVLNFVTNESGAEIEMDHLNVPDAVRAEVNTHWNTYYWDQWKEYLKAHAKASK